MSDILPDVKDGPTLLQFKPLKFILSKGSSLDLVLSFKANYVFENIKSNVKYKRFFMSYNIIILKAI